MSDKIEKMTDDDFKKIMQQLGMPESHSLLSALKQVENHTWQAARMVPDGYVMVPKTIHPFDRPDCDAVVQLLATPPDAGRIDNPQDYYQYWWSLLLSAAPEGKK